MLAFLFAASIIAIIITVYTVHGFIEKRNLKERFRGSYFNSEDIEYEPESLNIIRRYWDAKRNFEPTKVFVDDTTWDDLDMDRLFFAMNANQSSVGEEYLYAKLREPDFDTESLKRFGESTDFMENTPYTRAEALCALNNLGKMLYNNVHSYIYNIDEQPIKNIRKYYVFMSLPILSGLLCFVTPVGFFLLLAAFITNAAVYYRDKYLVEMHLSSLAYISKMAVCAKELSGLDYGGADYGRRLRDAERPFRKISGLAGALVRKQGSELDFLFEYFKIVLMWDFINYNKMIRILSKNKEAFHRMYELIGEIDCVISVSAYRKNLGFYSKPEFLESGNIVCEELYHPLIKGSVTNSIDWKHNALVTGSNASGKSTSSRLWR